MKNIITSAMLGALLMVSSVAGAAAPAPGETYVYRVSNGYNKLTLGKAQYRVENVDGGRIAVSMTSGCACARRAAHRDIRCRGKLAEA